jgi:cyclophilin family peptidyl-prolyl cis-trans isomerase
VPSAKRERKRQGRAARQEAIRAAQRRRARQRQFVLFVGLLAVVFVIGFFAFRGGGDKSSDTVDASGKEAAPCPKKTGQAKRAKFDAPQRMCINKSHTYLAKVTTDVGDFTITLEPKFAPITVNNFVVLARYHFYDGVPFHRVIGDFVVQGGDPTGTGSGGPGYKFNDESLDKTTYGPGDLAMANSGPNTNGSQFFIILSENGAKTLLSAQQGVPKYSRFGKVTSGMDVVKKIEADGAPASDANGTALKVKHNIVKVTIEES